MQGLAGSKNITNKQLDAIAQEAYGNSENANPNQGTSPTSSDTHPLEPSTKRRRTGDPSKKSPSIVSPAATAPRRVVKAQQPMQVDRSGSDVGGAKSIYGANFKYSDDSKKFSHNPFEESSKKKNPPNPFASSQDQVGNGVASSPSPNYVVNQVVLYTSSSRKMHNELATIKSVDVTVPPPSYTIQLNGKQKEINTDAAHLSFLKALYTDTSKGMINEVVTVLFEHSAEESYTIRLDSDGTRREIKTHKSHLSDLNTSRSN